MIKSIGIAAASEGPALASSGGVEARVAGGRGKGAAEGSPAPSHTIVRNPGPVRNASVDGLAGTGQG